MKTNTLLTPDLLHRIAAYWRAANYLSVGQIYLYDNPLLKRPRTLADVKHMLLGHWGTTAGQNFIYAHLNRVIKKYDLDMIYVSEQGPGDDEDEQPLRPPSERKWRAVMAGESGYIQGVNSEALVRLARDRNTIVWMDHRIGEFVVQNTTLASFALKEPPDQATTDDLQATFSISRHRTVDQDAAFGIRQIVDIALKALSPGINDSTTAVMCVDYLTAILARIAPRRIPSSRRYEEGELRVISKGPGFESLLAESFDQIRSNAKGDVAIMSRMLGAFQTLASLTVSPRRRRALGEQVQWIAELAERSIEPVHDRARIDTRLARVRESLDAEPGSCTGEGQDYKHGVNMSVVRNWN